MPSAVHLVGKSPVFLFPRWLLTLAVVLPLSVMNIQNAWCAEPKLYETYSTLRVRQGPGLGGVTPSEFLSLPAQIQLIKSPYVLNAALVMQVKTSQGERSVLQLPWIKSRMDTKTEVEWLAQQIQVRSFGGEGNQVGDIPQIGMLGDDPEQLEVLVNAVTKAYLERVGSEEKAALSAKRDLIEKTYYLKYQEVNRHRRLVYEIGKRVGAADSISAQGKQALLVDYTSLMRKGIVARKLELLHKEESLKQFQRKHGLAGKPNAPPIKDAAGVDGTKEAKTELARLEGELELYRAVTDRMASEYESLSQKMEDLGTSTEELDRRKEILANSLATANKLARMLEQYDLEARSPDRVTLLMDAPRPRLPLEEKSHSTK